MSDRVAPRPAASVILLREVDDGEVEVFLLRRHRKASFMASAFVFPGGAVDPGEDDLRVTAARELFEEAGVLLCREPIAAADLSRLRDEVCEDGADFHTAIAAAGHALALDLLQPFSHWITPSIEPKRFSAHFFTAVLPAGQTPSFDDRETVEERWVTPARGLADAAHLKLPPPQVRTLHELVELTATGLGGLATAVAARAGQLPPLLPRACTTDDGVALLLPWDPDYETRGDGDAAPIAADHPLATGPSRFVYEDDQWKHVHAPASTTAG